MTEENQKNYLPQAYSSDVDGAFPTTQMGSITPMSMSSESAREIGEVQGAIVVAQRCPRNENRAFKEILNACQRKSLAESATYCFPRGGQQVKGPSIRLAEVLARYWGNIQYGVRELARTDTETLFEAYCWDVQTNTRISRRFSQKHWRDRKNGKGYALTDERDIYEAVANAGSRRLRACILQVIPGDIVEAALEQCAKTKMGKSDLPMKDRIRQLVVAFDKFGVTEEMIEEFLGHKLDATTPEEFVDLRDIYTSLKDGVVSRDQWFSAPRSQSTQTDEINNKFAGNQSKKKNKKPNGSKKERKIKTFPVGELPPELDRSSKKEESGKPDQNAETPPPSGLDQAPTAFDSFPGGGL